MGIPNKEGDGITVLGSPLGSPTFVRREIEKSIGKVDVILQKLEDLEDPHVAYVLLRSCFSLPKVVHLLRTSDPLLSLDLWSTFDRAIQDALTRILGVGMSEIQWRQAQLPVSMTGMGLRGARDHAMSAYISSVLYAESFFPENQNLLSIERNFAELGRQLGTDITREGTVGM